MSRDYHASTVRDKLIALGLSVVIMVAVSAIVLTAR
jgi:hypothetical protein